MQFWSCGCLSMPVGGATNTTTECPNSLELGGRSLIKSAEKSSRSRLKVKTMHLDRDTTFKAGITAQMTSVCKQATNIQTRHQAQ